MQADEGLHEDPGVQAGSLKGNEMEIKRKRKEVFPLGLDPRLSLEMSAACSQGDGVPTEPLPREVPFVCAPVCSSQTVRKAGEPDHIKGGLDPRQAGLSVGSLPPSLNSGWQRLPCCLHRACRPGTDPVARCRYHGGFSTVSGSGHHYQGSYSQSWVKAFG